MAGDWIKMRVDLADDPAVVCIATILEIGEDEVVGKLHKLWSWADRHTVDGYAPNITAKWVDKFISRTGFATAMQTAGWLSIDASGIKFPSFDRHNGETAKKRGSATLRQRLSRKMRDKGVTGCDRDTIPKPYREYVYERDQFTCVYCGARSDVDREKGAHKRLSVDHITPATRGGTTTVDNLVTCCTLCNREKNDRTPDEWDLHPTFIASYVTYRDGRVTDSRDISVTEALPEKRRIEKKDSDKSESNRTCRFVRPTYEEVEAYCRERNNGVNPQSFMAYYDSNGWRVGKNPMKDWKASVRYWERNGSQSKPSGLSVAAKDLAI